MGCLVLTFLVLYVQVDVRRSMASKKMSSTHEMEFGGVFGTISMLFGLPLSVFFINLACNKNECTPWQLPSIPSSLSDYFDIEAVLIFHGWMAFQLFLYILPTGYIAQGLKLKTGKQLKYRCNAFLNFVISCIVFGYMVYSGWKVSVVYDKFLQLATTAIIFAAVLSVFVYIKSFTVPEEELASGGNTGYFSYDFFIGRELNPRIGPVDLKFFCELRPGLIGWVMLDLCFVAKAYEQGNASMALYLVTAFHAFYVADALWFEEAILTTMDIVHDGFGFMLAFGDLAWVPFVYCLQARFLLEHPQIWPNMYLAAFLALELLGYTIFRGANSQKNDFRQNPDNRRLKDLKTMPTASGKKLLISGWWGICRHPNYMGDLFMALAWSLPCGFQHILPYFYPLYFLGLLVNRFERDEVNCRKKYGSDWDKYCKIVTYKIFPFIY